MSVEVAGSGIGLGSPTLKSQKVLTLPQGCPVSFRESQFEMCFCSLVEGPQSRPYPFHLKLNLPSLETL